MYVTFVALVLSTGGGTVTGEQHRPANFRITTKRPDDVVKVRAEKVRAEKVRAVFSISSASGISHAVIERSSQSWPREVTLRLHLKGLEHFQVTNGTVKLEASASLRDGKPVVRQWQDGREGAPLDVTSPFWMGLRILDGNGQPARAIPLIDGCFEIGLPRALLDANPKALSVDWIDFYRN